MNNVLATNEILKYYAKIEKGEEVVSLKIKKVYKEIVENIIENQSGIWCYDHKEAEYAIQFIERFCKHSKGKMAGQPFILELWQRALIATMFGIVDRKTGLRKYQQVFLMVGRKNGKSTLSAAVGLYLMVADGERGPEIYAVATKKDQAKIIWREAKRMVLKSRDLRKKITPKVAEMESGFNEGVFLPLGRDSDTLDGLNVHGGLFDEVHAWKDMNLYDVVVDGTASRDNPLIFVTSTAGTVRESVFDRLYDEAEMIINGYDDPNGYKDESVLPIIYELDNKEEWRESKHWKKPNPGLGTIKNIETLGKKVNRAKAQPMMVKNLICKDFNIRETVGEAWLSFETIDNQACFDVKKLKPRYGIGGIDLSSTTDLTCATVLFMIPNDENIYVLQMYWLPEDVLEKRVIEDKIPYDKWKERGLLRTSEGNKVNYKDIVTWFLEIQNEQDIYIFGGGYDAWSSTYLVDDLKSNFGKNAFEPVRQGKITLSSPMKSLGADLEAKRIVYNNNPILKWCISNTSIEVDKNNNIQPIKGKNKRRRIDGLASLLDAYVYLENNLENYKTVVS